jgi:hypothetical protein
LATYLPKTPLKQEELVKLLPPKTGDSLAHLNLPGKGGIYESRNLGLYGYGHLNPLHYVDPDGNVVDVSDEMKPLVESLKANSPTAADILNKLHADPRKFSIRTGSDPSGGSAQPVAGGPQPSVFQRMLGKEGPPDNMVITVNVPLASRPNYTFVDLQGKDFHPSLERVLGHELGHAFIWATEGPVQLIANQPGAVRIENQIARELNPNSPVRHPTQDHGRPAWLQ